MLGVNGMTGRAIAAALVDAGHQVVGTGRSAERFPAVLRERGVEYLRSDRDDPAQVRAALGPGADVVVDVVAYTAAHARSVVAASSGLGSVVVVSSKAVYVDALGRHSNSDDPPDFGGPVSEDNPVLAPDVTGNYASREGYGRNKVAVEEVYRSAGVPVSVLRPSRVHGPGAAAPRETWVLDRVLAGQRVFRLPHAADAGNHPTAAVHLARLAVLCTERPAHRVLNSADPGTPTAGDVVRAVAAAAGVEVDVVDDPGGEPSPWSSWPPFFLDTSAAEALGYRPVGTHAGTVVTSVRDLLARRRASS
ncbi:NAD-dependent epimerase/dehydratase family protein [Kineococcus sp. DHX-1]|uniref:NAD-dependent epimerase/dehydratase family protein n=1 Tax=Kineococcus sp. DHX-1 TaxID=3349638 RepID=UPI0036D38173